MKKISIFVSTFTVLFALNTVLFAQPKEASPETDLDKVVSTDPTVPGEPVPVKVAPPCTCPQPQALPFGYPPYPTAEGYPTMGIPYSYPRAIRRSRTARIAPQQAYQPYQLPAPGSTPAAPYAYAPSQHAHPAPMVGTLGVNNPYANPYACQTGQPTVVYRPTPIKNFISLLTAPRPYIGYDPYAGYPPYPGYVPQQ